MTVKRIIKSTINEVNEICFSFLVIIGGVKVQNLSRSISQRRISLQEHSGTFLWFYQSQ